MNTPLDISVVILHYNDFAMTQAYIDNLKKQNWGGISHHFLIVDNASPDGSGKRLEEAYAGDPDTVVLLSETNHGFAKGNNLGIQFAASHFQSDMVVVSNNDIVIEDSEFMQKLAAVYLQEKFDVLGPDIFSTRKNIHQNPLRSRYLSTKELLDKIDEIDRTLWKLKIIDKLGVYDLISRIKKLVGKSHRDVPHFGAAKEGVVLHCAFFVLAEGYLKVYPDGLYPGTFLYMEEDALNYRAHRQNLKSLYDPSLSVLHLDGVSTLKSSGNRCKKYIFELEQTKLSCQSVLAYMEGKDKA